MTDIFRKITRRLPKTMRFFIYRKSLVLTPVSRHLKFKMAQSKWELEMAYKLLYESYVAEGYMRNNPAGLRITPYHALPSTVLLIALWDDEIVGTISIIRDNSFGLPLENEFATASIRGTGKNISEISSLAIKKEFRNNSSLILFPLLRYMYYFCIDYFAVHLLTICVHPKWHDFYCGILLFRPLDKKLLKNYGFAADAPGKTYYLDLIDSYQQYKKVYGNGNGNGKENNLFQYMTTDKFLLGGEL